MKQLLFMLVCAGSLISPGCGADSKCADAECDGADDEGDAVTESVVDCDAAGAPTYETWGQKFVARNCLGCHSSKKEGAARMEAPIGLDFDTLDDLRAVSDDVYQQVVYTRTMPLTGGVSDADRSKFAAWLDCGAP